MAASARGEGREGRGEQFLPGLYSSAVEAASTL